MQHQSKCRYIAYGDADWVMSDMMVSRDRSLVADIPVFFDSDYMVFVSPAAIEKSKATSLIKPFSKMVKEVSLIISSACPCHRCGCW